MKISTEIASAARLVGEEKAIEYYAKAGFDAWDFSMFSMCKYDWTNNTLLENDHPLASDDYLKFAKRLKKVADDCGIECNQSHAPFPTKCSEIRSFYKRAIECTAVAGGKICIIHPHNDLSPEGNAEIYMELLPFAKEYGVKIATENMFNWDCALDMMRPAACSSPESFVSHLDAVGDEYLTACLDIGHAEMLGTGTSAVEMIRALGNRLTALHIHDNDKRHDRHQIPFSMDIDFTEIVRALKEIDYKGYFTLEADACLRAYTAENVFDGVKCLYDSAKRLADMYDEL